MDQDLLLRELRSSFVGELDDQVRLYNAELLSLEKEGPQISAARVKILFRVAHTLKGGARAVEALALAELAHDLEEVLALVRTAAAPIDPEGFRALCAALFAAGDAIAAAGVALRSSAALEAEPMRPARETLTGWILEYGSRINATVPDLRVPTAQDLQDDRDRGQTAPTGETDAGQRVQASRLDALLGSSGELLIAVRRADRRNETLLQLAGEILVRAPQWAGSQKRGGVASKDPFAESAHALAAGVLEAARERGAVADAAGHLDEEIQSLRLLPFAEAIAGIDRVARDAALDGDKEVDLTIAGQEVLLDRGIIDELRDPLRHLIRNAVDHGIETTAERRAAGKPERGRVTVGARVLGASIEVTVSDDGRGIDVPRVRAELARRGSAVGDDPRAIERLLFEAGFSTAARVTSVSGRGVGLDVVRTRVQAMRGRVELSYAPGGGTTVRLMVPLTLTRLRVVLLRVGDQVLAVPSHQVESLQRVAPEDLPLVEGRHRLRTGGAPMAVSSLGRLLGMGAPAATLPPRIAIAVLTGTGSSAALMVDELLDELALTIKRLPRRLEGSPHLSGASVLPDGRVALILDVPAVVASAMAETGLDAVPAVAKPAHRRKRVLLVDDSITTRGLERSILEAAGYEVATASDGAEAWRLLQEQGADILVSDIEMPNLDGFQLTERVRQTARFARLPIVLVTGLASDSDRARGLELGADAYLVKGAFQQSSLVEAVADLVRSG